jgi:hypothetical protein
VGHLLKVLIGGFALGGAVEFQDGVDANFPDSLGYCSLLRADSEFALVFVAAEFAFDGNMRAFANGACEIGQFSESPHIDATRYAITTLQSHSSRTSWLPARIAILVALLTFFSASLPMKLIRVTLLRYIRFSVSALLSRAPGSEWARLPRPEAAFLGEPARGVT